jgi:hypothetical protein
MATIYKLMLVFSLPMAELFRWRNKVKIEMLKTTDEKESKHLNSE